MHRRPERPRPRGPEPSGDPVEATVKWFNPTKGFGFVELADGSGDVFLHISTVEATGNQDLPGGTRLQVLVGQGGKGRQISRIVEVLELGSGSDNRRPGPPRQPRGGFGGGDRFGGDRFGGGQDEGGEALQGTVKWFNPDKGFGFIDVNDGGKDVFVHVSKLQRAGMTNLAEGQRVSVRVVSTQKGREAASIEPLD